MSSGGAVAAAVAVVAAAAAEKADGVSLFSTVTLSSCGINYG